MVADIKAVTAGTTAIVREETPLHPTMPISVTAVAYDQGVFTGYYRDGQTVCMHQILDNANTSAEDPDWCSECRGEIRPSR